MDPYFSENSGRQRLSNRNADRLVRGRDQSHGLGGAYQAGPFVDSDAAMPIRVREPGAPDRASSNANEVCGASDICGTVVGAHGEKTLTF
jgi:hypothetical protein